MRPLLALLGVVFCSAQTALLNPTFKEGELGSQPPGWIVPPFSANAGYKVKITDQCHKPGARCGEITFWGAAAPNQAFGNLMQMLDGALYRGKRVRYRAWVRVESPTSARAQLWLRADLPNKRLGFFDNMESRPIVDREWKQYEIVADIEPDTERIALGVMHFGLQSISFAEPSIEILGDAKVAPAEPPRPLSGQGLRNLVAFARLTGYVRHFYPGDEARSVNWDLFAINGVRAVEEAQNSAALLPLLQQLFRPVAPQVQIFLTKLPPPLAVRRTSRMMSWKHTGYGAGNRGPYKSELVVEDAPENGLLPKPYEADLGVGLRCRIPLALPESRRSIPDPTSYLTSPFVHRASDRPVRLAGVILAWNTFQHFYPYFDVVKTDWPAALEDALRAAAADPNEAAYSRTLRKLVAALKDGHGGAFGPGVNQFIAPMILEWVEARIVVTHVADAQQWNISPGDTVLAINGKPAAQALAETETLVSGATPQWVRITALRRVTEGAQADAITFEVERYSDPSARSNISLRRISPAQIKEPRPDKIKEIDPGIWYLNLDEISDQDWKDTLPKLENAKGMVLDMRGYPGRLSPSFLQNLHDKPMTSAQWHVPVFLAPDRTRVEWTRGGEWNLQPAAPFLRAKKAFLIDGRAISYAESCLGIVEHYKLGELVGTPTAGTNGNVNPIRIPGGYQISWTGMKVLKHDGSRHHGVGILPTVPVTRTRSGIAEGRDEILEKAVLLLR